MIQFNLLPEVKQQYVNAERTKNLVMLVSFIAGGAALAVLVLMLLSVDVVQKKSLRDLNSDIASYTKQISGVSGINDILTVQNQLNTLTGLHDQKVVASRLSGYLAQITPAAATISSLKVDFTQNTISISGEAPSLDVVNSYTDTVKAANYTTNTITAPTKAFSAVVLATFGRDSKGATYTINANFDPAIFSNAAVPQLSVPPGTSSNTATLFQKQASK